MSLPTPSSHGEQRPSLKLGLQRGCDSCEGFSAPTGKGKGKLPHGPWGDKPGVKEVSPTKTHGPMPALLQPHCQRDPGSVFVLGFHLLRTPCQHVLRPQGTRPRNKGNSPEGGGKAGPFHIRGFSPACPRRAHPLHPRPNCFSGVMGPARASTSFHERAQPWCESWESHAFTAGRRVPSLAAAACMPGVLPETPLSGKWCPSSSKVDLHLEAR